MGLVGSPPSEATRELGDLALIAREFQLCRSVLASVPSSRSPAGADGEVFTGSEEREQKRAGITTGVGVAVETPCGPGDDGEAESEYR